MGLLEVVSLAAYLPLALVILVLPLAVYVLVRWRDDRDGRGRDPDLGAKTLIGLFLIVGLNMVLGALAALFGALFTGAEVEDVPGVLAVGLVGLIIVGLDGAFIARTNQRDRPGALRIYWGFSTVLSAFGALIGLLMWFTAIFAGRTSSWESKFGLALVLIYLPGWVAQLILIARRPTDEAPPSQPR